MGGGPVLEFFLEKQKSGDANQQNAYGHGDEVIDAVTVDIAEVNQKTDAEIRSRRTTRSQRQNHFAPDRPFAQVDDAGADLGNEVEKRVRSYGTYRWHMQTKDQNREQ